MAKNSGGRTSSIELLRIIAMLGVVILHYNNGTVGGGFLYAAEGSLNQYYLFFTENLFICAVDLFVLISAFFLSATGKRRFVKVAELLVQVILFRLAFFAVRVLRGGFTWKALVLAVLPANYFVILYLTLYVLSPYVNLLLRRLTREQFRRLILLSFLLFSAWTILVDALGKWNGGEISGLSTVGLYGSEHGYSIVNFLLLYLLGAYIRLQGVTLSRKKALAGAAVCFAVMACTSLAEHYIGTNDTTTWYYNNPFVIAMAVFVFLLFKDRKMECRPINALAEGAFTCFLFHGNFVKHLSVETMAAKPLPLFAAHQLGAAVGLYLLSYVVYLIYRACSGWFFRRIAPLCDRVNISVEE